MYFLIEDDNLLKKYNTIWDKVIADIKKKAFDFELVYSKDFLETKIISCGEVTDFYDKKLLRLTLIMLA